jgi:ABC-2 type transport system ATP-binding protein
VTAVRAGGLVKRFEGTLAVDGVDLELQEGEVRGLLGPNGAGKTTLLRMLFGLVQPDAGAIELFGGPLTGPDGIHLDHVAGFIEDPCFYPYLSGRVNLELLAELDRGSAQRPIDEVLDMVELTGRSEDRVSGYSSGMRQRLGIAATLLRAPRLVLLDEPMGGLDPAGVRAVGVMLRDLAAEGVAVLLSSHQIAEIEGICDSFTFLREGAVVWEGSASALRAQAPAGAYILRTNDDRRALEIAASKPGVAAAFSGDGGLALTARQGSLDAYALALGHAGVAIRRLELRVSPLESMFFALTRERRPEPMQAPELIANLSSSV